MTRHTRNSSKKGTKVVSKTGLPPVDAANQEDNGGELPFEQIQEANVGAVGSGKQTKRK